MNQRPNHTGRRRGPVRSTPSQPCGLAVRLKYHRLEGDLTQAEAADRAGVHRSVISRLESEEDEKALLRQAFVRFCHALGVHPVITLRPLRDGDTP